MRIANTRHPVQRMRQNPGRETTVADILGLIEEFGKESLFEKNADWVLLHRDRPLEVPHGK